MKSEFMERFKTFIISSLFVTVACFVIPLRVVAAEEEMTQSYEEELEQRANSNADAAANDAGDFADNSIRKVLKGSSDLQKATGRQVAEKILRTAYQFYTVLKVSARYIVTVSILIGVLLLVICRKNKKRRRMGLYGFIIGVPLITLILIYGIGILNGVYLGIAGETFETTPLYDSLKGRYLAYEPGGRTWFITVMNSIRITYDGIKIMTPVFILVFVTMGLFRVFLCKYDKRRRNIGLYGFCIGIPAALILVCTGAEIIGRVFI